MESARKPSNAKLRFFAKLNYLPSCSHARPNSNLKDKSSFTYFYQSKVFASTALIVKHDIQRVYPCHTSTEYVFQTQQPIPEWTRDLKMKRLKATGVFNSYLGQRFSLSLCRPNSMTRTNAQISKCLDVWQV